MTISLSPSYSCNVQGDRNLNCKEFYNFFSSRTELISNKRNKEYQKKLCYLLKDFLDSSGYFNFTIDTNTSSDTLVISLGKRCIIKKENIILLSPLSNIDTPLSPPAPGYPVVYNSDYIKKRAESIGRAFTAKGYPFVSVTTDVVLNRNIYDTAEITYYVEPDKYYTFTFPILSGNFNTKKEILFKDIGIKAKDPFSHLVIENSLRRLNSRNYITEARALSPIITRNKNDSSSSSNDEYITVPFLISDKYGMGIDGAVGFGSSLTQEKRFYGKLRFDFVNLFHRGESAHFYYDGNQSTQEVNIEYIQPWLLMLPLSGAINGGIEVANENYGYFYGSIGVLFEPSLNWYSGIRFVASDVAQGDSTTNVNNTFIGTDIVIIKSCGQHEDRELCTDFSIVTGSGFSKQASLISRSHIDLNIGLHIPLPLHTGLVLNFFTGNILTKDTNLTVPEMYQIGGSKSIRGYPEKEFSFTNVFYAQSEYHLYFNQSSSLYLFCDAGIGGRWYIFSQIKANLLPQKMMGYGIGLRGPTAIGVLSIELARNIFDSKNTPGRVHVRFQSPFSSKINNIFSNK